MIASSALAKILTAHTPLFNWTCVKEITETQVWELERKQHKSWIDFRLTSGQRSQARTSLSRLLRLNSSACCLLSTHPNSVLRNETRQLIRQEKASSQMKSSEHLQLDLVILESKLCYRMIDSHRTSSLRQLKMIASQFHSTFPTIERWRKLYTRGNYRWVLAHSIQIDYCYTTPLRWVGLMLKI